MEQYGVELDLHLVFTPPMDENGAGIVVTRQFRLPFVPYEGVRVFSSRWEDYPEPQGFELKEVVWDVDREVFLASSTLVHDGLPFAAIPDEVQLYLAKGWRLGSWADQCLVDEREPTQAQADGSRAKCWLGPSADDLIDQLHPMPAAKRPKEFNQFVKAMIRHMAQTHDNWPVAYAMDKTGMLFTDRDSDADEHLRREWRRLRDDFSRWPTSDQIKWADRVRKYPDLMRLLKQGR